ncbi:zinc finger protein 665-like [Aricia agestis]|uniref:zinc finger protein 665-like n=1 Tax=Aricia agestis TaxID=91739 RepID=UPI001C20A8D4|nr:zinc finger protein 665-like [Aricia agestis]
MNWTGQCLICNQTAYVMKGGAEIFNNKKPLKSKKELPSVISEIIKKPVTKGLTHSSMLCSKCNKMVVEYDLLVTRCQKIENDVLELFKVTLKKLEMDYDNYASTKVLEEETVQVKPIIITRNKPEPKADPKIVLSASKLQPLPPNFVLRPNIMPDVKKKVDLPIVTKLKPVDKEQMDTHSEDIAEQTEFSSLLKFNETNLHNYSLSAFSVDDSVKEESDENVDGDGDDNPMEIDEECTLTDSNLETSILQGMGEGFVRIVPAHTGDTADNVDRSDDDEGHTIVMDEDGSIIRVVSGQRFMLGDQEISLQVMPDEEALGDGQDSNDESQIELQVSGDEETANAIIAAAQEKGGAFIKVESGEMYRVESVESKDDSDEGADIPFQVEKKAEGLYRCKFCERYMSADKVFEGDASSMMSHLKTIHDARLYICTVCGKIIRRKSEYAKHLSSHSTGDSALLEKGKMYYECNECHRKFSSRVLLAEHLNTHAGARPYVCGECGKDFANKYTYQAHCKTHTNRPRPFKCNQCEKSFFSQQNLSQHEKTHSGIKDFLCKICGKAFGTQHNLEVHGVVHSRRKPFACRECGKAFARRAELRDHERIHTGERPFECEICHARFTQRSNLYSHRRATHTDDKRYACDRCPKRFKRKRLLDYHIKASHTGERPLTCDVCDAKFVYPEHYKKHMLIHSGAKPFQCEICGKSFSSRDNRNMHRFVHSDRKAYECLVCGASFMRKSLLYAHMNQRGHLAESIVINQPRIAIRSDNSKDDANAEGTETTSEPTEEVADTTESNIIGTTLNIAQDGATTMLAIHNADGELKTDEGLLQTFSVEQLDQSMLSDNVLVSAEGQDRPVMRLVQLQLRDGNTKWVAVDG